jgi:hypothetical protein
MKYQLETIPIWEAYEADTECPLCYLYEKLTKAFTTFFTGGSVMEPDTRSRVNELGFCFEHFSLLFGAGNKQGVALMAHTRLLTLRRSLSFTMKKLLSSELSKKGGSFLPKRKSGSRPLDGLAASLERSAKTCAFCNKLDNALSRYAFTIVYLWKKDEEFRLRFSRSKGFCIPHFARVIRMADSVLSQTHRNKLLAALFGAEEEHLSRIEEEILWYTQKFDYRNKDKPWKNSEDALQRAIGKLTGRTL